MEGLGRWPGLVEGWTPGWAWLTTGSPLSQGHFIVWEGTPGARMPWKGHHRHVFLFRHHLVVCKPKRDSRTDTFSYVFRNMMKVCRVPAEPGWAEGGHAGCAGRWRLLAGPAALSWVTMAQPASGCSACILPPQLSSIDLNDKVEGDDRAFEVWHEREDSVRKYLLQARTVITKNSWVKEICGIQQRLALPVWRECLGS